jgi:hypothetical protein
MQSNVVPIQQQSVDVLAQEAVALKERIGSAQDRLREIDEQLAAMAIFPKGKQTGTVEGDVFKIKVTLKEYSKWDQEALRQARGVLGDDAFFKVFTWEFKPISKKELDGYLKFAGDEYKNAVLNALTVTPGKPQVTYERVEG